MGKNIKICLIALFLASMLILSGCSSPFLDDFSLLKAIYDEQIEMVQQLKELNNQTKNLNRNFELAKECQGD